MKTKNKIQNPIKKITEINAPTYLNTTTLFSLDNVDFQLWDVVKCALAGRLNIGLGGGAGMGKSQLFADLKSMFNNNTNYVLGRNDLDIKSLYRQMDFKKLNNAMHNGGVVSQKEISSITDDIYRPLIIVEEINRCAEIVQNQLFNIFEGFIEIDGNKYCLGKGELKTFTDHDGTDVTQNVLYSVGVWSANFGNGQYTGTVSMDKALKERSHMIIDVDNFSPGKQNPSDLDNILMGSGGEIRLKDQEKPQDYVNNFIEAFSYLKQKSKTPDADELGRELLMFRYLVEGLDFIPSEKAQNSKRIMKEIWPAKAEEDGIGEGDDKLLYGCVFPSSIRSGLTIISLARSLREYAKAVNPKSQPKIEDSVVEAFKLVAPYSGIIENPHRIREDYVGNNYLCSKDIGNIIKNKLQNKSDVINAIVYFNRSGEPYSRELNDELKGEFSCWKK